MKRAEKIILPFLILVLAFFPQSFVYATEPAVSSHSKELTVRVMSFNIHAGIGADGLYDIERTADVIETSEADVIGLQEVDVHWGTRSHYENIIQKLANRLDMHYFFAPIYDLPPDQPGQPGRQYGLAVLSKYPIIDAKNHEITRLSTQSANPVPEPAPGFPEVLINAKGAKFSVYVTHLDYRPDPAVRSMQVADMRRIMSDSGVSQKVLVGDMNAAPDASELIPLYKTLRDTWTSTGESNGFTFPSLAPVRKIDYIFSTPCIRVKHTATIHTTASDHLPVIADLTLSKKR